MTTEGCSFRSHWEKIKKEPEKGLVYAPYIPIAFTGIGDVENEEKKGNLGKRTRRKKGGQAHRNERAI